jgi:hypothetical protein
MALAARKGSLAMGAQRPSPTLAPDQAFDRTAAPTGRSIGSGGRRRPATRPRSSEQRSEVQDARDRYANLEVSYLLQRIETFDAVVVLATNFEKSIDQAFVRRIHTRVDVAIPSPTERAAIWRQNPPSAAPAWTSTRTRTSDSPR